MRITFQYLLLIRCGCRIVSSHTPAAPTFYSHHRRGDRAEERYTFIDRPRARPKRRSDVPPITVEPIARDSLRYVNYDRHPYDRHARVMQVGGDLFAPLRIHFDT
eukprot:scaffold3209_cov103-Alexandrium_tamarense.AAC.1